MSDGLPHSADLRKHRFSQPGFGYLITKCPRRPLPFPLSDAPAADAIIRSIRWHQERELAHLLAFVVMPDHVHWAFVLGSDRTLGELMKGFSSVTSREIRCAMNLPCPHLWQQEYHDQGLRSIEQSWRKVQYIHENPIRRNLCSDPSQWPWSTAHPRFRAWIETDYLR
jgi:REP element-mobilizing transposase RayT